ncbi:hypothetical protein HW555_010175 [Spodoptera exigua]|uniref:N-terminal acetyltransferase B complex subunit MDM20 homolog n=1 Tax=Spodoptera exigua TaxID=7107 RepID=A0A835G9Y4_SPOEX|nr:hypothetical protein HW555_010175 [Spodoptera exigua]
MAHMHDGGIVERRLRPIYDWLDIGNNKKALQEAEKVLKKTPTLQAARALKALALFRLGKGLEAQVVLDALADEKPSDDTTLQAMTISYRESQQLHKVCMLYENAVKSEPTNEELHSHLFMSYVRVGDYRSQQRAAMALYKFAPKNPYYFWAVMSIVLQAKTSEDNTKRGILLALAQRMVDNFISENKMEAEQEARLYIMILELQEKWEDILKFIESPLYSQLVPGSTAQASIPYLKKLGQWKRLNVVCKELLWDNQDRWDYYVPYFDSVFYLMKENEEDADSSIDNTARKSMSSGRTLRGPYLARLELWKRLAVDGDPTSLIGSALCGARLEAVSWNDSTEEREEKCREFLTCLGFDENSEPESADDIQRHVSCLAAWRLVAAPQPSAGALELAATLRGHYLRCLQKGLVTSNITEFCPADNYGILASSAPIVEALCLLELVLHHSPANFHAKLLLVKLYHLLGNALAADSIYQRLEVKHIQLVSLGWLHCARLAPACLASRALQLLADTRAFLKHHGKDSVEHLTYAYKYGTFEKLVELSAWAARLEACADNRDLNVIVNYEPPQFQDENLKARTFDQEVSYLRLKDALVSAIALCIELADSRPVDEKKGHYEQLNTCIEAFSTAMEKCRQLYAEKERISISAPFPSRIIAFVNSPVPYRELYATILRLVGELAISRTAAAHDACQAVARLLPKAQDQLQDEIAVKGDPVWSMRDRLECLSNYLEFIGIITFLLGVCNELFSPASAKKSKKKTSHSPDEIKTSELLNELNNAVQTSITFLEHILDEWPKYEVSNMDEILAKLTLDDKYQSPVENKLKTGRDDMLNDVRNILKRKSKYLKSLLQ